ncbi:hypothetical protein Cgig2_011301 [Carnegiea gigantea]|uniref:Uncharacterized protein n=1 Tax=Carnegiea gigantea TaxID=171969 RepID=A0A9Q1JMX1_9CARY|nr:hypothetical protein Cgig2_011301 [Carnegiea gigantea]
MPCKEFITKAWSSTCATDALDNLTMTVQFYVGKLSKWNQMELGMMDVEIGKLEQWLKLQRDTMSHRDAVFEITEWKRSEGNLVVVEGLFGLPQVSYASTRWFHSKIGGSKGPLLSKLYILSHLFWLTSSESKHNDGGKFGGDCYGSSFMVRNHDGDMLMARVQQGHGFASSEVEEARAFGLKMAKRGRLH